MASPKNKTTASKATKPRSNKRAEAAHSTEPVFEDVTSYDVESGELGLLIASGPSSKLKEWVNAVDSVVVPEDTDIMDMLSREEAVSVGVNLESRSLTKDRDITYKLINNEEFINSVKYARKRVGITGVDVKAKGSLSGANAVAKFTNKLGIGKHTNITLWHSGFSIMVKPPKDSDFVNLQYAISKVEHTLGMETNNFVYSNYAAVINKLFANFVLSHVIASTLVLPEGDSYLDYILMTDIDALAIGIMAAIRPDGYNVTTTCDNTLELVDNKPKCDFTASAKVHSENLLWVNREMLSTISLAHISKTSPGSHSAESVLEYQASLEVNAEKTFTVDHNDVNMEFTVKTPTIGSHIDAGGLWVNNIIKEATKLFTEEDNHGSRENKIRELVVTSVLNKYNSYIKQIELDDSLVEDQATVSDILTMLSSETGVANSILHGIVDYIDTSYIALVATYMFDCPKCKEAGNVEESSEGPITGFREFIPLNAVEHFFDLSAQRYTKITNRVM